MPDHVFISHSSKDVAIAGAVCSSLEANGIPCWMAPRDIVSGESWAMAIMRGIRESRALVVVISNDSNQSQPVLDEIAGAYDRKIPIVPFRIHTVEIADELKFFLSRRQWLDATVGTAEQHLPMLVVQIRTLLKGPEATTASPSVKVTTPPLHPTDPATREQESSRTLGRIFDQAKTWFKNLAAAGTSQSFPVAENVNRPGRIDTQRRAGDAPEQNDFGLVFVRCQSGQFEMGDVKVSVTLTQDFWLGQTTVTQSQYQHVQGCNPSYFKGPTYPVVMVSWSDAKEFCRKLTEVERKAGRLHAGYVYSLPTEAQWEYACRAGTDTAYSFGDNESELDKHGWYNANSGGQIHDVKTREPNAWGLFDMHGNVWEWTSDWFGGELRGGRNPAGASSGSLRVLRGGGSDSRAPICRSASRRWNSPGYKYNDLGFRVAVVSSSQFKSG